MGMVVRTNTMANNAFRQLGMNNNQVSKSLEKLASGYRINRAGDDAAGLAISESMKAQIKGLEAASSNSQDAISLVQTAEGALTEVHDMLNRMVELATKAANGTYTDDQRGNYQDEIDQLQEEIDRIATSTKFNDTVLLNGTFQNKDMQVGTSANETISVSISGMRAGDLGVSGVDVSSQTGASAAIEAINNAINDVSDTRSLLGATQNRLEHTINNLDTTAENLSAANSRIRDTDMAKEMMKYTQTNVLVQSAQAMLAQANQQPQSVLQLLQ